MKCQDLLKFLNEYVDGTLDSSFCDQFEQHMVGCDPCQVVVDNIRKTITLYQAGQPCELPAHFRQHLHDMLRERWRTVHSSGETSSRKE
jgi:hypothetical protein